jgi:hypothetical protein
LVGAVFLAAASGGGRGFYYEVEVLEAYGDLCVGFAGTNLGPQCRRVGDDACSWGFCMENGYGRHRCVRGSSLGMRVAGNGACVLTQGRGGRGDWGHHRAGAELAGFDRAGAHVGVAWDAAAGALLVSVDGSDLAPLFPSDVAPGPAVGAGLYPAVSGSRCCRVRWNAGRQPFRHPPPPGFLPCAAAAPGEPRVRFSHVAR